MISSALFHSYETVFMKKGDKLQLTFISKVLGYYQQLVVERGK